MRKLLFSAGLLVAVAGAPVARADEAGEAEAKREFEAGLDQEKAGRAEEACAHFRRALERMRVSGPLEKAAQCDAREGRFVDAVAKEDELLSTLPEEHPDRATHASARAAWVGKIAKVTFVARKGAEGARVLVDGARSAPIGVVMDLDPGSHDVAVSLDGEKSTKRISITAGATLRIEVPFDAPSSSLSGLSIGGITSLALGGAAAIVAGVTGGLVLSNKSAADDACPGALSSPDCTDAIDAGKGLLTPNLVSWIVAGVGVGVGVTLLVVDATRGGHASRSSASVKIVASPSRVSLEASF